VRSPQVQPFAIAAVSYPHIAASLEYWRRGRSMPRSMPNGPAAGLRAVTPSAGFCTHPRRSVRWPWCPHDSRKVLVEAGSPSVHHGSRRPRTCPVGNRFHVSTRPACVSRWHQCSCSSGIAVSHFDGGVNGLANPWRALSIPSPETTSAKPTQGPKNPSRQRVVL